MSWFSLLLLTSSLSFAHQGAGFQVHEWGTFTTLVDSRGEDLGWNAFQASAPLPSFVHGGRGKLEASHKLRMETPVIYFHAEHALRASVQVDFVGGEFSEWYPAAQTDRDAQRGLHPTRSLHWPTVEISPQFEDLLPTELRGAHYTTARGVAATPLRVPMDDGSFEAEKFLFYRGTADFVAPLGARLEGDRVVVHNRCAHRIDDALLFQRHGDTFWSERVSGLEPGAERVFDLRNAVFSDAFSLDELKQVLRAQGLREDESQAMVDTWRADWFLAGLRVFYTVPRAFTDEVLPLRIQPVPDAVERVLLGRVEIVEPELQRLAVEAARDVTAKDAAERMQGLQARYGRIALAYLSALAADPAYADLDRGPYLLLNHGEAWR